MLNAVMLPRGFIVYVPVNPEPSLPPPVAVRLPAVYPLPAFYMARAVAPSPPTPVSVIEEGLHVSKAYGLAIA